MCRSIRGIAIILALLSLLSACSPASSNASQPEAALSEGPGEEPVATEPVTPAGTSLYALRDTNGKWGYIDREGNGIIAPKFDETSRAVSIEKTDRDLLPARLGDFWGYIDLKGEWVLNPRYKSAAAFCEGAACVTTLDDRQIFIDREGQEVDPPVPLGYKDFSFSRELSEGLKLKEYEIQLTGGSIGTEEIFGYIDAQGEWAIPPQFRLHVGADKNDNLVKYEFSEGVAVMYSSGPMMPGSCYGYISPQGGWKIPPQYEKAYQFSEGLAPVRKGGLWGFIDHSGAWAIPPQYRDARTFSEGVAAVRTQNGWGFIDHLGNWVIEDWISDYAYPAAHESSTYNLTFQNGSVAMMSWNPSAERFLYGLLNKQGEWLVEPEYRYIKPFDDNGIAIAFRDFKTGSLVSYINRDGRVVAEYYDPPFYED